MASGLDMEREMNHTSTEEVRIHTKPKISVPRAAVFAGEQAQRNVAQFVQSAFGSGKQDQHHDADAGQNYFGFHGQ